MVNKPTEAELIRQMGDRLAKINGLDAVESKTDDTLVDDDTILIGANPYGTPYQGLLRDNEG
jgi:hypothetical protein